MKSLISLRKTNVFKIGIAAFAALSFTVAQAEPVKPVGPYSESKLEKTTSGQSEEGLQGEVKRWARDKWHTLKSFAAEWMGTPAQPKRLANQPTKQAPRAPASPGAPAAAPAQTAPQQAQVPAVAEPSVQSPAVSVDYPGVKRTETGVVVYDMSSVDAIPRLSVEKEEKVSASRYALEAQNKKIMDQRVISPFETPDLVSVPKFKELTKVTKVTPAAHVKDVVFAPKGKVSRAAFDKIALNLAPETEVKLKKFTPLTPEEFRFLSGLLLYQQGDKCAAAVGLFHKLSQSKAWQPEANYYLAMCSKKLGLQSDFHERARRILESRDVYYTQKILKEVDADTPYEFTDAFGAALNKVAGDPKIMQGLDADTKGNVAYWMTEYGSSTNRFKTVLAWAKQVPEKHPKRMQARFLEALALYETGSKQAALKAQESLINDLNTDKQKAEFQALVALNVARMYFQEKDFKNAHENFLKVYKDHPMWLQSLTELGWSQLMSGDFEGAIGNMYSIQSPYFSIVYKPESYVIRTIGYLDLCQYGDAYRTLSLLERHYRPWLGMMDNYMKSAGGKTAYYQTVKSYLLAERSAGAKNPGPKQMDGLPAPVIREMARHRDFTNLQKALNRQLDERPIYDRLDAEIEKSLKRAQWLVNNSRRRATELRRKIGSIRKNPQMEQNRNMWNAELSKELEVLNDHFFHIDLFNEAKSDLAGYKKEMIKGADSRVVGMRTKLEKVLASRMKRMRTDLARILDNNELLRYEVFAGSGENIRYQVAGGEKGNRVPASVIPKSKSLQWDFDGEYWEDEIGHYRSSLKNNCPDSGHHDQASLGGGDE